MLISKHYESVVSGNEDVEIVFVADPSRQWWYVISPVLYYKLILVTSFQVISYFVNPLPQLDTVLNHESLFKIG